MLRAGRDNWEAIRTNGPSTSTRLYSLDWLRAFVILLLIPFHSAIVYTPSGGSYVQAFAYIGRTGGSIGMAALSGFLWEWFMPLLFFISGISAWFALSRRTPALFIRERLQKLAIPAVFGTLVIVPVLTYFFAMNQRGFKGGFSAFLPRFFGPFFPTGYFNWGHFWFLIYLAIYSLLALPLLLWLQRHQERVKAAAARLSTGVRIYAPAVALMLIEAALRFRWPGDFHSIIHDWAYFLEFFLLFLFGYGFAASPAFFARVKRQWGWSLGLAVTVILAIFAVDATGNSPAGAYSAWFILYRAAHSLNTWAWILFWLGLAGAFCNYRNRLLDYASAAAFPFYMLHFLPVTIFSYYAVGLYPQGPVLGLFLGVVVLSIPATLLLYELLVRRIRPLRFLFGSK